MSDAIDKEVGNTTQEARLQALRTELWKKPLFQNAGEAYRRLAKQGCDMGVAMGYVRRVAGYKRGNGRRAFRIPPSKAISRKARLIRRQLTKLANQTAEFRKIWGFWERMVDADAIHVPEELMNIAARLSCLNTAGFGDWFPQKEAVLELLELVQTATGRPHYVEVSSLINAELVWVAAKSGRPILEMAFDPDSLKMIVRRAKQRQAAKAKKHSEMKKRLKSLSVQRSPRQMLGLDPIE